MKKRKIIAVYWKDIHFDESWQHDDLLNKEIPVFITYGVKLKGGDPLIVAGCISPADTEKRFADVTRIPKGCIVKVEVLGKVDFI